MKNDAEDLLAARNEGYAMRKTCWRLAMKATPL